MWKFRHRRLVASARSLLENGIVIAKSQCGRSRGNPRSLVNQALNGQCLFSASIQLTERISVLEVSSSISVGPFWPERGLNGEFDPGSGRTLAACLTHASRTRSIQ